MYGVPDQPPEGIEFKDSLDDESCPNCGYDTEDARLDHNAAFNAGVILAVNVQSGGFAAASGTQFATLYFRCPECKTPFSTDEESFVGGMA